MEKWLTKEVQEYLRENRRYLHQHPELSEKEYETSKYIQRKLDELGISYEVLEERSVIGTIEGLKGDKVLGIRADMDALPMKEESRCEFSSLNEGVMHSCGHDCHTAILLGTAKVLMNLRNQFHGKVKLIFQEAEETMTGAVHIIKSGLVSDVDNYIGLHVEPHYPVGTVEIGYGVRTMKWAGITVTILGTGGHASNPECLVNPVQVGVQVINALSQILAFETDKRDFLTLTPTMFHGGEKDNIIGEKAIINYDCRYYDKKFDKFLSERIPEVVKAVCEIYHATADVYVDIWGECIENERESTDRLMKAIKEAGYRQIDRGISASGEDYAYFQLEKPGTFAWVGAHVEGNDKDLHSPYLLLNEEALTVGTDIEVRYALDYLK